MNKTENTERATLNLWPQTARLLGIGKAAVYQAAHSGELPVIKMGSRLLVSRAALEKMLREGKAA